MSLKKVAAFEDLSQELVNDLIKTEFDIIGKGFKFKANKNINDILEMREAYLQGQNPLIEPCLNDMAEVFEIWLYETLDYVA